MEQIEFRAMGSRIEAYLDRDGAQVRRSLRDLPRRFECWEQVLSRFRATSGLNQLNRRAGDGPYRVDPLLYAVIERSVAAARESNGLVTPTVLPALEQIGYVQSFEPGAPEGEVAAGAEPLRPVEQPAQIGLDRRRRTVRLERGVRLDLGGIGKSWAAQRAVQLLQRRGPALVSAGGDIAVSGPMADGRPWVVAIGDPFGSVPYLATLYLRRGGLATSGIDYRRWQRGTQTVHHIIDPRSGAPAVTDLLTVSVAARPLIAAETLARSILIAGRRELERRLDDGAAPALLAVTVDGDVLISPAMMRRVISLHLPERRTIGVD